MPDEHIAKAGLAHAVARFPEAAAVLRRLALADLEFREVCVEYELALASLGRFAARPDADQRLEVEDDWTVIAELEVEIGRFVRDARSRG